MYFKKIFFSISLFFGVHAIVVAQSSVTVTPENPSIYDTLTITYNASLGNKALMNFSNTVYMHSGLITATSATQSDWKYAIGNWGTDDKPSMMKKVAGNLYQKNIVLKDYYGVPANEEIKFMTFVFRDVTGTNVGKDEQNKDIFVAVKVKTVADKKVFLKNYVSHQFTNNTLIIKSDTACLVVKPYTDN